MNEMLSVVLAYASLVAFALAMHRHQRQVCRRPLSARSSWLLRTVGTAGLGASFAICVVHSGWSVGPVLWFGLLTAAGFALVLLLAYRPRSAVAGALLAFPAGVVAAVTLTLQ